MRVLPVLSVCLISWGAIAQAPNRYQFIRAFDVAREAGDRAGMEAAVRASPDHAMDHFKALCWEKRSVPEDAQLRATLTALRAAWGDVRGTDKAMASVETFIVGLPEPLVQQLNAANDELQACLRIVAGAERSGSREALLAAGARTRTNAVVFEELGDFEHAAEAWGAVARVISLIANRSAAEQAGMLEALRSFVRLRESWGWVFDPAYAQNVAFLQVQADAGQPEPESIPYLDTLVAGVEETVADLEFEMLDKLDEDMFVHGGPVPTLWASIIHENSGPARFPFFKRGSLFLVREASQRFGVTTDSSESVYEVRVRARPERSLFYLDAAKAEPYAMWFFVGGGAERYMETELNLLPAPDRAIVFYRSASSWTTSIAGEKVVFYDDNSDGRLFIGDPFELNVAVRTLGRVDEHGTRVPAWDSMQIGRGPRVPYSEVVQIKGRWYRIRGLEDGTMVGSRPIEPDSLKTGRVELDWSGNRRSAPELLIIQGRGELGSVAFDLGSGNPVEVPAGDYEISFGRIVVGRGDRARMAQIFRGESEPFTVEAGQTFSLEMGEPFHFEFEREGTDPELAIDAAKIRVLDVSGAQYGMLHGAVPAPDVVASTNADGRGAVVVGGFATIVDPELALLFARHSPLLSYSAVSFPRPNQADGLAGDLVLRLRLPVPGMVVGLQQDRHPLFGKLEPVFK